MTQSLHGWHHMFACAHVPATVVSYLGTFNQPFLTRLFFCLPTQTKQGMSKNDELKKLRERIEELEFVKDLQQDIIADFEKETGLEFAKKLLPEALVKEIERKKKSLTK